MLRLRAVRTFAHMGGSAAIWTPGLAVWHHPRGAPMTNIARNLLACLLVAVLCSACYEAGNKEDCVGFKCPAGGQWPEGGTVTLSHLYLPDGVSSLRQIYAYFISDQSPDFPPPQIPGHCFQLDPMEYQFRNEVDAGQTVTVSGGGEELVAQRFTNADCDSETPPPNGCTEGKVLDFDFGQHDIVYLFATNETPTDDFFDSTFTTETAETMPFSNVLDGTYMPPAVRQLQPPPGVVQIHKGQPLEVAWEPRTPYNPDVPIIGTILFVDPTLNEKGSIDTWPWACMVANTGSYTVPADITAQLSPRGGIMQVGYITNQAVVTDDGRAINLFATECQASLWMLVE